MKHSAPTEDVSMIRVCCCRFRNAIYHQLRHKCFQVRNHQCILIFYSLCVLASLSSVYLLCLAYPHFWVWTYHQWVDPKLLAALELHMPRVKEVNCSIFMGPPSAWNETLQELSDLSVPEERFNFTNCMTLRSKWLHIPTTPMEEQFPIAFSILVYKDLPRLTRLLRAVYRPTNVYCIHVDQRSNEAIKAGVTNLANCLENVIRPPGQIRVFWGGTGVLEAEMVCLRALWKHPLKWRYFINLTGEEFPLKTNLELVYILSLMNDRNDVWLDPCTYGGPGNWNTTGCKKLTPSGWRERWVNLTAPYDIQAYKGQVHVVLSRPAVDYLLHNQMALDVYNWALQTFIPDENYFATMNSNPSLNFPGSNPDPKVRRHSIARIKLWWSRHAEVWPSCSKYLRSVCLFTARELPLLTSSPQLFANKFKTQYRPLGYACLEQWYFQKVLKELAEGQVQLDMSTYRRIFQTGSSQKSSVLPDFIGTH